MNTPTSKQPKLTYEQRLSQDLQEILADNGIDASTHPNHYANLVRGLSMYIKEETRRSFVNGRNSTGANREDPKARHESRFQYMGKPSAYRAGKLGPRK